MSHLDKVFNAVENRVDPSLQRWLRYEQQRRVMNGVYILMAIVCAALSFTISAGILISLPFVGIAAGLSNVFLLVGRPSIDATDDEIRQAAVEMPPWAQRRISRLDQ